MSVRRRNKIHENDFMKKLLKNNTEKYFTQNKMIKQIYDLMGGIAKKKLNHIFA